MDHIKFIFEMIIKGISADLTLFTDFPHGNLSKRNGFQQFLNTFCNQTLCSR